MQKTAKLYRMVTPKHICPFGLKSKDLLQREGYLVEDHLLKSQTEADDFRAQYDVKTTPQTFIDGKRIGGYDDLKIYFGKVKPGDEDKKTYKPVIAVFASTLLMSLAVLSSNALNIGPIRVLELFIAFSMCVLAILKLQNLESFSNQFITYDLLAMRMIRYSYIYPFLELFAGLGMIDQKSSILVASISLFIGSVGAISVFKAVYIDKRDLKCACVGGGSNVPLGFISLTENIMMISMGVWMLFKYFY